MVPLLAETLGVAPEKVFYRWAITRCASRGRILKTDWTYWFHGLECELENREDGRLLRIDFGPGGRFDTFSAWGVMQFVMRSQAPWKVFPELRSYLAKEEPALGGEGRSASRKPSGSYQKLRGLTGFLVDYVEEVGCPAQDGELPEDWGTNYPGFWDRMVAHRVRLSGGKELGRGV